MARTSNDFFNDFDELMKKNALLPDYVPARLIHYNINGIDVGPEDIVRIVQGIKEGNKEQLNRWFDLKEYLTKTLDLIEDNKSHEYDDRESFEKTYGFRRHLGLVEEVNVPLIEYGMELIIKRLLHNEFDFIMNPTQFSEFFGLMNTSEQMALTSLEKQGIEKKNKERMTLPSAIFDFEIGPYLGKKVKGGKTKLRRDKMKKTKTIRRKARKTRKNKRTR